MAKRDPMTIDWVLLGMYGWDIDRTGAGYYGLAAGDMGGISVGSPDCDPWAYCHLDLATLDLIGGGPPEFWLARITELQLAGLWPWRTTAETAGTCPPVILKVTQ